MDEWGHLCHRRKLLHSHCKLRAVIVIDFSDVFEKLHQIVSKT